METEIRNIIKIDYLEDGNVFIKSNGGNNDVIYVDVMDALGDIDIIACNEINESELDMLIDSNKNIYLFQIKEITDLIDNNETELVKQGRLNDFIDFNNKVHLDFLRWYL